MGYNATIWRGGVHVGKMHLTAVIVSSPFSPFAAALHQSRVFVRIPLQWICRFSLLTHAPFGTAANICFTAAGRYSRVCQLATKLQLNSNRSSPITGILTRGKYEWRPSSAQINSAHYCGSLAHSVYRIQIIKLNRTLLFLPYRYIVRFASTFAGGQALSKFCANVTNKNRSFGSRRSDSAGDSPHVRVSSNVRVHSPVESATSKSCASSAEQSSGSNAGSINNSSAYLHCLADNIKHGSVLSVGKNRGGGAGAATRSPCRALERISAVTLTKLAPRDRRLCLFAQKISSKSSSNQMEEQPTVSEFFPQVDGEHRLQVTSGSHPIVDAAFEKLLDSLTTLDDPRLKNFADWLRQVIEYNVPEGKRNRLVAVMLAYQSLEKTEMTDDKLEKAALLGWCVELLQAFFLICDDIMDNSLTRRGKTCWHLIEGVQMVAINDAILCETAVYRVLKTFFRSSPNYLDLLELFHEASFQTSSGQCLDLLSERQGGGYVEERYNAIVLYKTAFYSFSLPVRLGMYLAGIADQSSHKKAEALALRIGHIFQVQDDFLDCYGIPEVIGKIGTDIVDAKCSWLVVKALEIATPAQKKTLLENYGKGKPGGPEEAVVKKLYDELEMAEVFREAEGRAFADIREEVAKIELRSDSFGLNTDIFKLLVNKIYKRNK